MSLSEDEVCPLCQIGNLKEGEPLCKWGKAVSWDFECQNCMSEFRQERGADWHVLADNFTKETEAEKKERQANARLIAAAPDMLHALQEMMAGDRNPGRCHGVQAALRSNGRSGQKSRRRRVNEEAKMPEMFI